MLLMGVFSCVLRQNVHNVYVNLSEIRLEVVFATPVGNTIGRKRMKRKILLPYLVKDSNL